MIACHACHFDIINTHIHPLDAPIQQLVSLNKQILEGFFFPWTMHN